MKRILTKLVISCCFLFCSQLSYSQQSVAIDTNTYTFKLILNDPILSSLCGDISIPSTLEYSVVESDYKHPIYLVAITHICRQQPLFKKGKIYLVEGTIDFTKKHYRYGLYSSRTDMPLLVCKKFQPEFLPTSNGKTVSD